PTARLAHRRRDASLLGADRFACRVIEIDSDEETHRKQDLPRNHENTKQKVCIFRAFVFSWLISPLRLCPAKTSGRVSATSAAACSSRPAPTGTSPSRDRREIEKFARAPSPERWPRLRQWPRVCQEVHRRDPLRRGCPS